MREVTAPSYDLDNNEYPIEERFPPELVATMMNLTDLSTQPEQHWAFGDGAFALPLPYQLTVEEIFASNFAVRSPLLSKATLAIAPLQYAVDLEEATAAEVVLLKKWKLHSVALNRISQRELMEEAVQWPVEPTWFFGGLVFKY